MPLPPLRRDFRLAAAMMLPPYARRHIAMLLQRAADIDVLRDIIAAATLVMSLQSPHAAVSKMPADCHFADATLMPFYDATRCASDFTRSCYVFFIRRADSA